MSSSAIGSLVCDRMDAAAQRAQGRDTLARRHVTIGIPWIRETTRIIDAAALESPSTLVARAGHTESITRAAREGQRDQSSRAPAEIQARSLATSGSSSRIGALSGICARVLPARSFGSQRESTW